MFLNLLYFVKFYYVSHRPNVFQYFGSFFAHKGIDQGFVHKSLSLIYFGLVDMFFTNLVDIDREVIFSSAIHTDINFVKNTFLDSKTDIADKISAKVSYDHHTFSVLQYFM